MSDQLSFNSDPLKRDIPSFIEPHPPLVLNPFMRPRPQKGINLMELFDEESESETPEWLQVYLRLKPCNIRSNLYEVRSDRCLITSVDTAPMGHGRRTQHNVSKMYTFSHIFGPEANQKEIFETVVKDNLKKLPEGQNFTLLTYGASGSGKTYTLMGTVQCPGLVPRSLEYVFHVVDAAQQPMYKPVDGDPVKLGHYEQENEVQFVRRLRQISAPLRDKYRRMSTQLRNDLATSTLDLSNRRRYFVWVSFVEIYNEAIYDLLSNSDRSKATSKLRIREDCNGQVYVKGATQAFVRTGEEAYDVMVAGKHNLQVAATGVHANSSRSHCIFTITMLTETEDGVRTSCVRLCDLAGCERQRMARNTGARMQESRAINSSLHVLERCLHMLRRKQKKVDATLVPYRESKLTRLLGAGLSGCRGESVGMVVTLNPAPQCSHETRHVLQLAAVAKDIQVNQTVQEATFESSTQESSMEPSIDLMRLREENDRLHFELVHAQESSMEPSIDLMRLREENDRLHFELVQAQHRNKELLETMEEKQQETAKTMYEIVAEAKDMTREYYEAQLQALQRDMKEMQEEYEAQLKALAASGDKKRLTEVNEGTPSRSLQKKVTALMTELAILEEKLAAERLARARAEEEVQHLRACIDERDEKLEEDSKQSEEEVLSITDDEESEEENDKYKESLEPTFKKEDINRSRLLQRSIVHDNDTNDIADNHDTTVEENNETINSNDSRENTIKDSAYDDDTNATEKSWPASKINDTNADSLMIGRNNQDESDNVIDQNKDVKKTARDSLMDSHDDHDVVPQTDHVDTVDDNHGAISEVNNETSNNNCRENTVKDSAYDDDYTNATENTSPALKFIDSSATDILMISHKNHNGTSRIDDVIDHKDKNKTCNMMNRHDDHKDTTQIDHEKINKTKCESSINGPDNHTIPLIDDNKVRNKTKSAIRGTYVVNDDQDKSIKEPIKPTHTRDASLFKFEQLEMATKVYNHYEKTVDAFTDVKAFLKTSKEKRKNFFDFDNDSDLIPKSKPKENYFDYIGTNKNLARAKQLLSDERSPSIVKEDITNDLEPSTMKKLLGESFTRQPDRLSAVTTISLPKKQASVDIFESPQIFTAQEVPKSAEKSISCQVTEKQCNDVQEAKVNLVTNDLGSTKTVRKEPCDVFIKPMEVQKPSLANESLTKQDNNVSIFEKCIEKKASLCQKEKVDIIGNTCKLINELCLKAQCNHKHEFGDVKKILERPSDITQENIVPSTSQDQSNNWFSHDPKGSCNNTIEFFDNLYKDITPRATEFELLISQNNSNLNEPPMNIGTDVEKPKYNLRHDKMNTSDKQNEVRIKTEVDDNDEFIAQKINNNKKDISAFKKDITAQNETIDSKASNDKDEAMNKKVQEESQTKCESQSKPKRNLRLRRRNKNETEDTAKRLNMKLKDIVNLQKEFSDVTMDVPAPVKNAKDIDSPEKEGEENKPPLQEIQSCPNKSVTRSRRKLFTPRAEPLEESMAQSGDSNERVRVPRPSYHRTRARRKL